MRSAYRFVLTSEHVGVARVLGLAVVAPADVGGEPQAPQDRGGQEEGAAGGVAVAEGDEERGQGGQGDADAPGGVHHGVLAGLEGDEEGDALQDQQRRPR